MEVEFLEMPFLPNDTYLNRGEDSLEQTTWTSSVYKFDASTFYNWEQDNLPLYDLEERTNLAWQLQGYPTSSLDGITLVVSGSNADTETPYTTFSTVSAALETLPKSLRFPVIIEVAASGDLGEIKVEDFEFYDNGGLEIINRGMAKLITASATVTAASPYSTHSSGTGFSSIGFVSSIDLSNTMADSSALGVSSNVSADLNSSLWGRTLRGFVRMADQYLPTLTQDGYGTPGLPPQVDLRPNNITVNVNLDATSPFLVDPRPNVFRFTDYLDQTSGLDYNAILSGSPLTNGAGPYQFRATDLGTLLEAATSPAVTGFMYANTVRKLLVRNCNGPVYIRGFCVDGAVIGATDYLGPTDSGFKHDVETGIVVESSDIVLENCAVMRCTKVGAKISNSRVILNRGFTAYRNYDLSSATVRAPDTVGYGLVANNSEITLSAATGPIEDGFPTLSSFEKGMGLNSPYSFASNNVGIQLNNSVLKTPVGGRGKDYEGTIVDPSLIRNYQLYMDAFLNTSGGIEINNSDLDVNHTLTAFQNGKGLLVNSSRLDVDEFIVDHNAGVGLEVDNSLVTYYKNLAGSLPAASYPSPSPVLNFLSNGTNLKLTNAFFKAPTFINYHTQGVENRFTIEGIGYEKELSGAAAKCTPGTVLNNSVCELLSMQSDNGITDDKFGPDYTSILGTAFVANNNSFLKFMGASGSTFTTYLRGPSGVYNKRINTATVYADNNSTVEFNGPTVLNNAGVNVGANNNSTIRFAPHNYDGVLGASAFCLSDTNMHTRVMLQSYKTCLGANNNSTIEMIDCGDFNAQWKNEDGDVDLDTYVTGTYIPNALYNPADRERKSHYVSGGFMQFYPNPEVSRMSMDARWSPSSSYITPAGGIKPALGGGNAPITAGGLGAKIYYDYSQGGWCVRADKGSEVIVKNVHFPCGFPNASSTILDLSAGPSGALCGKTYLWGIGDDSRLHASYVSISGHYPSSVGYNGPSGVYLSAPWNPEDDCGAPVSLAAPLSAVPSATPDTGRLSVLDSFGLRTAYTSVQTCAAPLGAISVPENKGPFRIYFSVNPLAKYLGYTRGGTNGDPDHLANTFQLSSNVNAGISTGTSGCWRGIEGVINYPPSALEVGEPYQVLAQGYNPSRDCSSVAVGGARNTTTSALSATYNQLAWQNPTYTYASGSQFVLGGDAGGLRSLDQLLLRVWYDRSFLCY